MVIKNANKRQYKIVNKKRFISFLLLTFIVIITIIFVFARTSKVYSSTYKENYIAIIIKEGDTLWDIAIKNTPEKYDIRQMVYEIIEFNQMEDAYIYPGDLIKIPIK